MVNDPFRVVVVRFIDDVCHYGRESDFEFVRFGYAEADSQRVLRIGVQEKNTLALSGKPDAKVRGGSGFSAPAFLVGDNDCFANMIFFFLFFKAKDFCVSVPFNVLS